MNGYDQGKAGETRHGMPGGDDARGGSLHQLGLGLAGWTDRAFSDAGQSGQLLGVNANTVEIDISHSLLLL